MTLIYDCFHTTTACKNCILTDLVKQLQGLGRDEVKQAAF